MEVSSPHDGQAKFFNSNAREEGSNMNSRPHGSVRFTIHGNNFFSVNKISNAKRENVYSRGR